MKLLDWVKFVSRLQELLEFPMEEFDTNNDMSYKNSRKRIIRTDYNFIFIKLRPFIITSYIGLTIIVFYKNNTIFYFLFFIASLMSLALCIKPIIEYIKNREEIYMQKGILHRASYLKPLHKKALKKYIKILVRRKSHVLYLREFSLEYHQERVKHEELINYFMIPQKDKEYLRTDTKNFDREFEKDIVSVCKKIPIVALQNIRECIDGMNITALNEDMLKLFSSDKNWEDLIVEMINYSNWIIIFLSKGSKSVMWEIHVAKELKRQERTLIIHKDEDFRKYNDWLSNFLSDFPFQCSKKETKENLQRLINS